MSVPFHRQIKPVRLTERENAVLELAAAGSTDKEIARKLGISHDTVTTYWLRIRQKLGGSNRTEAVATVLQGRAAVEIGELDQRLKTIVSNVPIALFACNADGEITVSEGLALSSFLGISEHSVSRSIYDVVPSIPELIAAINSALDGIESTISVKVAGRHWDVHLAPSEIEFGEPSGLVGVARDITGHVEAEHVMQLMLEGTARSTGHEFFRDMVKALATTLGFAHALVAKVEHQDNEERLRALGCWSCDHFVTDLQYDVTDTPCEQTIEKGLFVAEEGVCGLFPKDEMLVELGVESYIGRRIVGDGNETLGVVALLHDRPIQALPMYEFILEVFAARAGAELKQLEANKLVQSTKEMLQKVTDTIPGVVYRYRRFPDRSKEFLFMSRGAIDLFELNKTDVVPNDFTDWWQRLHPDDRDRLTTTIEPGLLGPDPIVMEYRILTDKGSYKWVRDSSMPEPPAADGSVVWNGVVVDISSMKATEDELRVERQRYQNVVNAQSELVCRCLPDTTLTFVNDAYCRFFGRTHEELIGRKYVELVPDASLRQSLADLNTALNDRLAAEGSVTHDFVAVNGAGEERYLEWSKWAVRGSDGEFREIQAVGRDITERVLAEQALQESEERLRQMAENIDEIFWITDIRQQKLLYICPKYEKVFGRSVEDLYVNPKDFYAAVHPDDRDQVQDAFDHIAETEGIDLNYRVVDAHGAIRWMRERGFPVRNDTGEVVRIVGITEDITTQVEHEHMLKQGEERFRALSLLSNDAVYVCTVDENDVPHMEWASAGIASLFGFSADELGSEHEWIMHTHPTQVEAASKRLGRLLAGEPYESVHPILAADGSTKWVWVANRPEVDPETGRVTRFIGAVKDMTAAVTAKEEQRRCEGMLRAAVDQSPFGKLVYDRIGLRLICLNQAFRELWRLPGAPEDYSLDQVAQHCAKQTTEPKRFLQELAGEPEQPGHREYTYTLTSGERVHVDMHVHPGHDALIAGWVWTCRVDDT